jgi:hypothetical protein
MDQYVFIEGIVGAAADMAVSFHHQHATPQLTGDAFRQNTARKTGADYDEVVQTENRPDWPG